jgi:hypothetical protein
MNQKGMIAAAAVVIASLVSVGMAQPAFAAAGPNATLGAPHAQTGTTSAGGTSTTFGNPH